MNSSSPIKTLGGILEAFLDHEKAEIAKFEAEGVKITHGPTIGNIYEGLTVKLLSKAVPEQLNLRVANGFISGKDGSLSGQIDCMLVNGFGKQIPNTDHEIVPLENVLVVLEVKKTLYGAAFADILDHFDQLMDLDPNLSEPIAAEDIFRTFSQITSIHLEDRKDIESEEFHHQLIYHSLVSEFVRPVRIAIGYDGFKTESGLRKSFISLMNENLGKSWIPPTNWPDLLISGDFSMVKLNGRPFFSPTRGEFWDLFATTRVRPLQLLLEFVYTEISKVGGMEDFWGEDLEQEVLNPFLQGKAVKQGDKGGWEWLHIELDEDQLSQTPLAQSWTPYFPDEEETIVFHMLMKSTDGLDIAEIEKGIGERANPLVEKITKSGLVAKRGDKLFLTTIQAQMGFYKGKSFVGENNTERLSRWLMRELELARNASNA